MKWNTTTWGHSLSEWILEVLFRFQLIEQVQKQRNSILIEQQHMKTVIFAWVNILLQFEQLNMYILFNITEYSS